MLHAYNKLLSCSLSDNYNSDWIYNAEKTTPPTPSCVLAAGFVSHRFVNRRVHISSIPESGKGRGELKTRGDLPIKASQ